MNLYIIIINVQRSKAILIRTVVFLCGSMRRNLEGILVPPKDEVVIQDCVEFFRRNSFSFSFKVWRIFSTISDGLLLELPVRIPN